MKRFVQTLTTTGLALFMIAARANASTVTFNTNGSGTGFNGTSSLVLNSTSGAAATLTFLPEPSSTIGVPTNANYGIFSILCNSCSNLAGGGGAIFPNFTFNLMINNTGPGPTFAPIATGRFVGTSEGNNVYRDQSQIRINWVPTILGTGTNNALTGNFGATSFDINQTSRIVAPNSGANDGQTTVQGTVRGLTGVPVADAIPEPVTLGVVGCALVGFVVARRKMSAGR